MSSSSGRAGDERIKPPQYHTTHHHHLEQRRHSPSITKKKELLNDNHSTYNDTHLPYYHRYHQNQRRFILYLKSNAIAHLGNGSSYLAGVQIASLSCTILHTTFEMFYVTIFLSIYKLSLRYYAIGSAIYALVTTVNDVIGAWLVDSISSSSSCLEDGSRTSNVRVSSERSRMVGVSGLLFSICFLTPFFRWDNESSPHIDQQQEDSQNIWALFHFIISMSLYNTMYSFINTILLGSMVADQHGLSNEQRIQFMSSGQVATMIVSFVAGRIGLYIFNTTNYSNENNEIGGNVAQQMKNFRRYLFLLSFTSCILFVLAQRMIHYSFSAATKESSTISTSKEQSLPSRRSFPLSRLLRKRTLRHIENKNSDVTNDDETNIDNENNDKTTALSSTNTNNRFHNENEKDKKVTKWNKRIRIKKSLRDLLHHRNFRTWIVMEMLLKSQCNFSMSFLRLFVDLLLYHRGSTLSTMLKKEGKEGVMGANLRNAISRVAGNNIDGIDGGSSLWSRSACDWLLSSIYPLTQMTMLALYLPVQKIGYQRVYSLLFQTKFILSFVVLLFASPNATEAIAAFLMINSVVTGAVVNAGFHLLPLSDLVLEMKLKLARDEGRYHEPSLVGMFMGVNAMFCKPMGAFLPIVAVSWLGKVGFSATTTTGDGIGDQNERILADYLGSDGSGTITAADPSTENTDENANENIRWVLFYMMVGPAFLFSIIQYFVWKRYNLTSDRIERVRSELRQLYSKKHKEDHDQQIQP